MSYQQGGGYQTIEDGQAPSVSPQQQQQQQQKSKTPDFPQAQLAVPLHYGNDAFTHTPEPPTVNGYPSQFSSFTGAAGGQRLADTFSLGRGVKTLGLIDAAMLLVNAVLYGGPLFMVLIILGCWGPIAGYVSGKDYSLMWSRLYLVYYCLKVLNDTFHLFVFSLWYVVPLAIDCYIGRFVYVYCVLLSEASDAEIDSLRDNPSAWQQARNYFVVF